MARDPAFLFYPGDWLGGTMTFSRSHKGAYMDLLMAQYNNGHMVLEDIRYVLGESDFTSMWEQKLKAKFIQDEKGFFYNQKLDQEILKRKKFTDSRKDNLKSKPHIKTHKTSHMNNHMENENENRNEDINSNEFNSFGKSENLLIPRMSKVFKEALPNYLPNTKLDYQPLFFIANFLCEQAGVEGGPVVNLENVLIAWEPICKFIASDKFHCQQSLKTISNHIQSITQKAIHGDKSIKSKSTKIDDDTLKRKHSERYAE